MVRSLPASMAGASTGETRTQARGASAILAFAVVSGVQLWLVAVAGTDIPFHDQWDAEGAHLVPAIRDGTYTWRDLFAPHNEHRVVWTNLLNGVLLWANRGQWDPLVQQVANAFLHGTCAAALVWFFARGLSGQRAGLTALVVSLAFAPIAAWHNSLWGFQSQVYFALLFTILALGVLTREPAVSRGRYLGGVVAAGSAFLAMGPGMFVPMALLLLGLLRWREGPFRSREAGLWLLLLALAWVLRVDVTAHNELKADSVGSFLSAFGRMAAWPHTGQPFAALIVNLPVAVMVIARLRGKVAATTAGNLSVALALWALLLAGAIAWGRGGGAEFVAGVPSRYVDLIVLLPLANVGCLLFGWRELPAARRPVLRVAAAAWCAFLLVGWVGVSSESLRRVILPRASDRDAPVRLMAEFQRTGNESVFDGQPRLLVPHPNPDAVRAVLMDPRMQGGLPPSLQLGQALGPLSHAARLLLGRAPAGGS